jgi:hypothetical protein
MDINSQIYREIKTSCNRPFSFGWIDKDRRKAWFADFGLEDLRAWVAAEAVAAAAETAAAGETAAAEAATAAVEVTAAVAAMEKRTELWDCVLGKYEYVIQTGRQETHFIFCEKFETSEILFSQKW